MLITVTDSSYLQLIAPAPVFIEYNKELAARNFKKINAKGVLSLKMIYHFRKKIQKVIYAI